MITLLLLSFSLAAPPSISSPGLGPDRLENPEVVSGSVDDGDKEARVGLLMVDARQPAEVLVDGVKLAQVYHPGEVRFNIVEGKHTLRIYTLGKPQDHAIEVKAGRALEVLIGRTGVSLSDPVALPGSDHVGATEVEFRLVGDRSTQVVIDGRRHRVDHGARLLLDLAAGDHKMSVRSSEGTVVWANGILVVNGKHVSVQLAEGRMPEVSGTGRFIAGGG